MKRLQSLRLFLLSLILFLPLAHKAFAQGFGMPLTIQGLDHFTMPSAASRGAGGITVGLQNNIGIMFLDPSSLQTLQGIQISFGGPVRYSDARQVQQYAPLKYYSNFSLLMEGLTGSIGTPDTSKLGGRIPNAGDSVQRPFDGFGPNWTRSKSKTPHIQVFGAIPFSVDDMKFAVGIGSVEYANLNWYFQNNNVLSPSILSVKQSTITLPVNNLDPTSIPVQWYQSFQSREGSIYGYGGALSVAVSEKLAFGVSGMILKGNSDDNEERIERGRIVFYNSYFRLDSIYNRRTNSGTSEYSGQEFTFSGSYQSRHLGIGFSIKPPTTITRKFKGQQYTDTTGSTTVGTANGEDKILIPWRGTIGLSIVLRENLTLGIGYELRSYAFAEYKKSDGTKTNPWLSSNLFHVGAEFIPLPWLALRAGVREQAEVFEPEGASLEGEPVSYAIYSVGAGVKIAGAHLDIAYEYSKMKYTDTWADAISMNSETCRNIIAEFSYDIPW